MGFRIVMLGAPGAGKGTQAQRLAASHGLPHISTGDIFRANLKEGTALGKQVREYLDSGRLVPDDLTCAIVADRLAQADCTDGFILDGFPRSVPQADALGRVLREQRRQVDAAVNIAVPDQEIVERLTARRTCAVCGAIYNLKFTPPKGDPGHCDRPGCPGELTQRDDDREETVRRRLAVYHETTEPIIGYYEREGVLKTVGGANDTPDQVFQQIEAALSAMGGA